MWQTVGMVFVGIGAVLSLVGLVWALISAFKDGPVWGIGILLLFPLMYPIWFFKNRSEAWPPLVMIISGWVPSVVGVAIMAAETMTT